MSETNYTGIDYGLGQTNKDLASNIRYGVINQHEVLQAWADSSEPDYGCPDWPECPECGQMHKAKEWGETIACECGESFDVELPDCAEPLGFTYESEGYSAQAGECGDIFVLKSPYFTHAQFCSPCAPGACYLMSPLETPDENNKAYCFGHDWFEDGLAPYPVYSVTTGEIVTPKE